MNAITKGNVPHHLRSNSIDFHKIKAGSSVYARDDLYLRRSPTYLGIAMSENGCQEFAMCKAYLFKNGVRCSEASSSEYMYAYLGFRRCADRPVTFEHFKRGMLLFQLGSSEAKDFTVRNKGSVVGYGMSKLNTALHIRIQFRRPLPEDVNLVVYQEIDHLL